jgi:Amt family ammonium transporter
VGVSTDRGAARRPIRLRDAKVVAGLSLFTLLVLIVIGRVTHPGDAAGTATGGLRDFLGATGGNSVPVSQVGLNQLAQEAGHARVSINFTWLLYAASLVLFMQAGFALLTTGLTRAKNAGHMMMLNFSAFVVAFLAYYAIGFAFHFGGVAPLANLGGVGVLNGLHPTGNWGLIGSKGFFLQSGGTYDVGALALFMFEVVFMETAGYIIIGAIAERITFAGLIAAELAIGGLIYPIFGNWVWGGGWLAHLGQTFHLGHGTVDFAGSGVVHATGGFAALALAMLLGPRIGKFNQDGTPNALPGHDLGYVVIGTFILLFGWMGFNPGSTLGATDLRIAVVAVNTVLAACCGAAAAMAWTNWKYGKPDVSMACNGMLAGCVAITAPCAFVAPWAAVVIGLVAGVIVCKGVWFFDHVARIDDPCGAISVHGLCGVWGVVAVGLFADGTYGAGWNGVGGTVRGLLYGDVGQLGAQLVSVLVNFAWVFGVTFGLFAVLRRLITFRVSPDVELEGLDRAEFGTVCYPEFVLAPTAGIPARASSAASDSTSPAPTGERDEGAGNGEPTLFEVPEELVAETARRVLEMVRAGRTDPD